MSMIAIPVPHDVLEKIHDINLDCDKTDILNSHITLFYLGDGISIDEFSKCIEACLNITKKQESFIIELDSYTSFKKGKHGFPIICPVETDEVFDLHKNLKDELDELEVEYSKKFPDFKPHLTLSFSNDECEGNFPLICWQVDRIAIYGGDEGKERVYAELRFGGEIEKSSHYLNELSDHFYKLAK